MKPLLTPHGPGFSFIDSFTWDQPKLVLRTQKWLDPQLPFFADHFPGAPLMPGVLLIESAAQAAGLFWGEILLTAPPPSFRLAQVLTFKIHHAVLPGQTIACVVRMEKDFGMLAQFQTEIFIADLSVAGGRLVLAQP